MAKAKLKLNSAAIKEFFVLHVEKVVLGCMLLLVVLFVYLGSVVETFPTTKTPQTLTNVISTADANILQDTWPKVEPTVRPPSIENPIVISVQPDPWQLGSLDPAILPSRSKRRDPKIYPPIKLVVDAARAAAAFIPGDEEIPPIEEKYAEMTEVASSPLDPLEDKKPKKKAKPPRPGSEMESMPAEVNLAPNPASLLPRPLLEDEKLVLQGYRGTNAGVPRSRNVIVVKALVPFKKQLDEYLDALGGPSNPNFDAERDTPKYIYFWVERADVTDNPNADPKDLKWEIRSTNEAKQLPLMPKWEWEGIPEELIDPAYILPGVTLPVPPMLLTDLKKLGGHPDVPWAADLVESLNPRTGQPVEPGATEGPDAEVPDFLQPGGGLEGGPGGMQRPVAGGGGMSAREGGGGFRQNMGGGSLNDLSASYKLLRFTDFKVEPGRKYRYRVRLTLENPNHPQKIVTGSATGAASGGGVSKDPPPQSLDRDVEAGLRELAKEEAKKGKRIFYRDTDWSEPSPVISLPDPVTIAGGEVTPGRETKVPGGKVPTSEPSGKVMVIQWDDYFAANVIGEDDVARGTVMNFSPKEAEALHPLRLEFVKMKDYPIRANSVVVDLRGGEKLPGGDPQEPLYAPGEIAVIDPNGQLVVHGEAQDNPLWQRYGKFEPKPVDPTLGMPGSSGEPGRGLEEVLTPKRPSRTRRTGGE